MQNIFIHLVANGNGLVGHKSTTKVWTFLLVLVYSFGMFRCFFFDFFSGSFTAFKNIALNEHKLKCIVRGCIIKRFTFTSDLHFEECEKTKPHTISRQANRLPKNRWRKQIKYWRRHHKHTQRLLFLRLSYSFTFNAE